MTVPKLYLLVRSDLSPGARVSQAVHGQDEFRSEHPETHAQWRLDSNTVAVLGVRDLEHLMELIDLADMYEIPCSTFREPDMAYEATVLVLAPHPAVKYLTAKLPLLA